jgi:serine protease
VKKQSLWILGVLFAMFALLFVLSIHVRIDREAEASGGDLAAFMDGPASVDPATGAVLIDIDDDASAEEHLAIARKLRAAIAPFAWPSDVNALGEELHDDANLYRVVPPASEIGDVLRALHRDPNVEVVEVERTWAIPESEQAFAVPESPPEAADDPDRFVPNDPYYRYQWHMDQIGMPEAWTRNRGAGAVVAVIDTGVAHRNEGRFSRAPDLEQTRFVEGYDFVRNDAHPDDEHGHGTHCAGTIAQSTHNGVGVTGVAPEATIMPLKVLDASGRGGWGAIAAAIRHAADNGANVISMSLGGGMPSRAVQRAIEYAHDKGVVVIAAAGNASRSRVEYPARHAHVIAVGAVRFDRTLSFYSSYGEGLDLVAPGGDLRVDQNGDGMPDGVVQNTLVGGNPKRFDYLAWQGTSMATPHVAGVAALLHSAGVRDPDTIERILKESALDLGDARRYGSGLVQASAALRLAEQGTGAARAGLALGVSALVLLWLRRRQKLGVGPIAASALALFVAGGLGALPWFWIPSVGGSLGSALSLGVLGNAANLLGPYGALLALSVLPAFLAVMLGLHVTRLRSVLVGLCFGSAAFLFVEALWPTALVAILPAVLVGPWLVLNGVLALGLGALVASRGGEAAGR